jgi:predicted CoA-binding protein
VLAYHAAVKEIGDFADVVAVLVVVVAAMALVAVAEDGIDNTRSNVSQIGVSAAATAALYREAGYCILESCGYAGGVSEERCTAAGGAVFLGWIGAARCTPLIYAE